MKPVSLILKYEYLVINEGSPVIVSFDLDDTSLEKLLVLLRKYQSVIGYSLDDIKRVIPTLVMHQIHLDDEHLTSID